MNINHSNERKQRIPLETSALGAERNEHPPRFERTSGAGSSGIMVHWDVAVMRVGDMMCVTRVAFGRAAVNDCTINCGGGVNMAKIAPVAIATF